MHTVGSISGIGIHERCRNDYRPAVSGIGSGNPVILAHAFTYMLHSWYHLNPCARPSHNNSLHAWRMISNVGTQGQSLELMREQRRLKQVSFSNLLSIGFYECHSKSSISSPLAVKGFQFGAAANLSPCFLKASITSSGFPSQPGGIFSLTNA
jgi:hypothetical protein